MRIFRFFAFLFLLEIGHFSFSCCAIVGSSLSTRRLSAIFPIKGQYLNNRQQTKIKKIKWENPTTLLLYSHRLKVTRSIVQLTLSGRVENLHEKIQNFPARRRRFPSRDHRSWSSSGRPPFLSNITNTTTCRQLTASTHNFEIKPKPRRCVVTFSGTLWLSYSSVMGRTCVNVGRKQYLSEFSLIQQC